MQLQNSWGVGLADVLLHHRSRKQYPIRKTEKNPNPRTKIQIQTERPRSKSEPCCKAALKTKDPKAARFKLRLYENQVTSVPCEKDNTDKKPKSIEVIKAPAQNGGLLFLDDVKSIVEKRSILLIKIIHLQF